MDEPTAPRHRSSPARDLRRLPPRRALAAATAGALAGGAVALGAFLGTAPAAAVSTRSFRLDTAEELAAGELEGTSARSDGTVVVGVSPRRVALPDVALAYAVVRGDGGRVFLGTGNEGKVLVVRGDRVDELAATEQLVVSSLALGPDGTLFAGTLPDGKIFAIDTAGGDDAAQPLASPEGVEHVWDLVWDPRRRVLFAATGPGGQVHAIDPSGNASVWYEGTSGHVMSLALEEPGGALYAGTDGEAVVLRLEGPGDATVVGDFPGNEVTAVAVADSVVAVAANEFPDPPRAPSGSSKTRGRPSRPKPGKGKLFRIEGDGRIEPLHAVDESHYTDLAFDADGGILAALGADGRVVRVARDRTHATWVDVEERQVLALDVTDPAEPLLATGDVGALYRVRRGQRGSDTPTWTSDVLDAGFVARFGALEWRGEGLRLATRTGNTARPDATWSAWSRPTARPAPVRSPPGRYLQIRATFTGANAALHAVEAFYLPRNQRPLVRDVALDEDAMDKRRQGRSPDQPPAPSAELPLTWAVDNPDEDRLRFRLRFREEGAGGAWRPILRPTEILDDPRYVWDTAGIPDGRYIVEVEASDELANPADRVLTSTATSAPLLVDNHPPRIVSLAEEGGRVVGRAVDDLGPIALLEVAIDGDDWRLLFPVDDLLDGAEERFRVPLDGLSPGSHIVAVRATDAGGNAVTAERTVRVR